MKQKHISQARQMLKKSAKNEMENLKEKALSQLEYAQGAFENATSKARRYVKTNPVKALMIAAGIGIAVGVVASSFMNGKHKNHR